MNWDAIRKEYETSDITLKALAEKHEIKLGTLKSRKSREGWEKNATSVATSKKKGATKKKRMQKNRSGNPDPPNQFAKRNSAAVKHGLFSKYLPQETLDIMQEVETKSTADMIWDQIVIQYTAIIRAQKIMFVVDKDDMAKEQSQYGFGESGADKYDIQFAWDRHATFMNAQSRAMSELRSLIKQFDEIAHVEDERRLKLEQMQLGIQKTKAEVDKLEQGDDAKPIEIMIKRKGDVS